MGNKPGDRFTPNEGEWKEVSAEESATLFILSAKELVRAFLRAEPLHDVGNIHVPEELHAPDTEATGIEWLNGGPVVKMMRWDPAEGVTDLLGEVEWAGVGTHGFLLTVDPMDNGAYQLWGAPALVP